MQRLVVSREPVRALGFSMDLCAGCAWEPQMSSVDVFGVPRCTSEFEEVERFVRSTHERCTVIKVDRVQNMRLLEGYALEREHMRVKNAGEVTELYLFHGTGSHDPYCVACSDDGIDFRRSHKSKYNAVGCGAYFALQSRLSHEYRHRGGGGGGGTSSTLVAKVLLGYVNDVGYHLSLNLLCLLPALSGVSAAHLSVSR